MRAFAKRNFLEIIRDPLSVFFGVCFPLVLILLLNMIGRRAPVPMFRIESLAPGIAVFSLSFLSLFSALLISRDRESALMLRLTASPMKAADFIAGYALPLLPAALLQGVASFAAAAALGMRVTARIPAVLIALMPCAAVYIAIGLICGSVLNEKQVGSICGALLTNLSAWLSGAWFDVALVGGAFAKIAKALPFLNAVESLRAVLRGDTAAAWRSMRIVLAYALLLSAAAVFIFSKKLRKR